MKKFADRPLAAGSAALYVTLFSITALLVGDRVRDDRGSESAEKSLMMILSIGLGGLVAAAATAYVVSKTALFK